MIGPADRAVSAREENRTAEKAFAIRFDARRDDGSRLRTFDQDCTHVQPPVCFPSFFLLGRASPGGRSSLRPLPDCLAFKGDLARSLQSPGDAFLKRLGSLDRDLLSEIPQLLVLCRCEVEILARLAEREPHDVRGRLRAGEAGEEIQGGSGVDAGDLDDLGSIVSSALGVGRTGLSQSVRHSSRGNLHPLAALLQLHDALLGNPAENARHRCPQ